MSTPQLHQFVDVGRWPRAGPVAGVSRCRCRTRLTGGTSTINDLICSGISLVSPLHGPPSRCGRAGSVTIPARQRQSKIRSNVIGQTQVNTACARSRRDPTCWSGKAIAEISRPDIWRSMHANGGGVGSRLRDMARISQSEPVGVPAVGTKPSETRPVRNGALLGLRSRATPADAVRRLAARQFVQIDHRRFAHHDVRSRIGAQSPRPFDDIGAGYGEITIEEVPGQTTAPRG